VEFRLLGPVEVVVSGRLVDPGPPRQRTVLAALAVDAARPVQVDTLIERVWGAEPPQRVRNTLHVYITRIRKVIDTAGTGGAAPARLVRRSSGYVLETEPEQVDLHRFRALARRAASSALADPQRLELLRAALALWRGAPLADLPGGWVGRIGHAWQQEHLAVVSRWAETELRSGDDRRVVGPLTELAEQRPLDESVMAMLMRALQATGRGAEALERYQLIRTRLVADLGVDPGTELQQLQRQILRGELDPPARAAPAASANEVGPRVTGAPGPRPPRQLPADVREFTGRRRELTDLDALLADHAADAPSSAEPPPQPPLVVAVTGTAGVGKTGLVVHWAHRVRDRFPDGQLYLDLRGHGPDQPMATAAALARLLAALGTREQDIPIEVDERASRYRMAAADRRLLIVLDNALSVEQVRPLLPGSASCTVLVTSRDRLAGLVAIHGAHRLDLDVLPTGDAVRLLRRLIGARVDAEPAQTSTLVQQCARLPLALRVAAELAASRPTASLADLTTELADHQRRLELLDAGYSRADVTTVFSWSIAHLPAAAVRAFRLLGLHPGHEFDAYALAALTATSLPRASSTLRLLASAHLVQPAANDRYSMHDLLRAYASRLAATNTSADRRQAALDRLLDYYLAAASAAMDSIFPGERHRRPPAPHLTTAVPDLADPRSARGWLDAECATLVQVTQYAATHSRASHSVRLSPTLFRYLASGRFSDGLLIHEHACRAARALGDPAGEGHGLLGLIDANLQLGHPHTAHDLAERALSLFRQAPDRSGEARALYSLGMIDWLSGRYDQATEHAGPALGVAREAGDETGEAKAHCLFGLVALMQGRLARAKARFQSAAALHRRCGDRSGEGYAVHNLGCVEQRRRHYQQAVELQQHALMLFQSIGDRAGQALTLDGLAKAYAGLNEPDQAVDALEQALLIVRDIGDRRTEPAALNSLGDIVRSTGRYAEAAVHHTAAHTVAIDADAPIEQARAHAGLGETYLALNQPEQAQAHFEQALVLYRQLGVPEAHTVQSSLDAIRRGRRVKAPDVPR
jgi:DNA-binding SARP family transcriptional activator/tetratricopeptide (TPR) repeat protein